MKLTNINQAVHNRANVQRAIELINNRINNIAGHKSGVDVVFKPNEAITADVLDSLLSNTNLQWQNENIIHNAVIYEAEVPSSINDLCPGMWKAHIVREDGTFVADSYSPLEMFNRYADGSVMFNPNQQTITDLDKKNYGGNMQNAIVPLISGEMNDDTVQTITSNILSSEVINIDSLYFIQNTDIISQNYNGAQAESFTLHFE